MRLPQVPVRAPIPPDILSILSIPVNSLRVLRVFVFNAAPPPLRLALISLLLLTASLSHASSLLPPAPVTHHYGIYMLGSRVGLVFNRKP